MITRKEILNPHSDKYNIHTHIYFCLRNITYRCGHTHNEHIEYCKVKDRDDRVNRLARLLCTDCEDDQLERIKREYE